MRNKEAKGKPPPTERQYELRHKFPHELLFKIHDKVRTFSYSKINIVYGTKDEHGLLNYIDSRLEDRMKDKKKKADRNKVI